MTFDQLKRAAIAKLSSKKDMPEWYYDNTFNGSQLLKLEMLFVLQPETFKNIINVSNIDKDFIYFEDKYGEYRYTFRKLIEGKYPTAKSSLDKIKYYNNKLTESRPDLKGKYEVIDIIESDRVVLQSKYGSLKYYMTHLLNGINPTIACAIDKRQYYINQANEVHDNYYSYSKLDYINENSKIMVTCPVHGDYEVLACAHKSGAKCNICQSMKHHGKYNLKTAERNKESWQNKKAYLYVLELKSETELFTKVGITNNFNKRINSIKSHVKDIYKVKILEKYPTNLYEAIKLESEMLNVKRCLIRYTPEHYFAGHTECYLSTNQIDVNKLEDIKYLKRLYINE